MPPTTRRQLKLAAILALVPVMAASTWIRGGQASRVSAAEVPGSRATAAVGADPTPARIGGHEPAGFSRITERSFDKAAEDEWHGSVIRNFSIVVDQHAPHSPPYVGQALYPRGFRGGYEPIVLSRSLGTGHTAIYLTFWFKLSDDFFGHPSSGVNKIFHIWIAGRNRVYLSAQGRGRASLQPQVRLQEVFAPKRFINLRPNLERPTIKRGIWYRWELLLKTNTPGQADGVAKWWINGDLAGSYDNIAFVDRGMPRDWRRIQWAPTWGGVRDHIERPQEMWMDHIYVSGN